MLSLARQRLHQHQPGSYSLLRLHPTVDLHDLLSTGQVPWKCVCVSERAFCFLGKVYTGLKSTSLFSSDSSSPNHQADPGSHGNSEVSDTPARTEQRCKRDSGVDDDVIDCFAACVLSHCQAVTTRLNSAEALLMVLVTFVLFLKSQIKTSAVTNTCCHVTWYVFLP